MVEFHKIAKVNCGTRKKMIKKVDAEKTINSDTVDTMVPTRINETSVFEKNKTMPPTSTSFLVFFLQRVVPVLLR